MSGFNQSAAARGGAAGVERVVVLMGGPDAERAVSIESGRAVAAALTRAGYDVRSETIGRPDEAELRALLRRHGLTADAEAPLALGGGVVFPALHGPFGEGGELQRALESIGVGFVGSGSAGSRLAIDKIATKQAAAELAATMTPRAAHAESSSDAPMRIGVSRTWLLTEADDLPPAPLPLVVKPNFEGSTVGLHVCRDMADWSAAVNDSQSHKPARATIAEPFATGIELTVGLVPTESADPSTAADAAAGTEMGESLRALPLIEIRPAAGLYDYEAKYTRDDTAYVPEPEAPGLEPAVLQRFSLALAATMQLRDLARADFIYSPETRTAWFLEVNTMPGFTSHSLLPKAAAHVGVSFEALCDRLVAAAGVRAGATPARSRNRSARRQQDV